MSESRTFRGRAFPVLTEIRAERLRIPATIIQLHVETNISTWRLSIIEREPSVATAEELAKIREALDRLSEKA